MSATGIKAHIENGKEEFSAFVKGYMSVRKMTADDLSGRLGMSSRTLDRRIRTGNFSLPEILAITYILNIDPELTDRILHKKRKGGKEA